MRILSLATALLWVPSVRATKAATTEVVREMMRFDQVYIPVLALTSVEQLEPSRKAYVGLSKGWGEFQQVCSEASPDDRYWSADLEEVNASIVKAGQIIDTGAQLREAHEHLEHVRQVMMHARERSGIEYFVDHLTRFHDPMEVIVLKCKNTPSDQLAQSDVVELRHPLELGEAFWAKVKAAEFDSELFEFDQKREATMRQSMLSVEQAMATLEPRTFQLSHPTALAGGS
jgi:hypothetical protein